MTVYGVTFPVSPRDETGANIQRAKGTQLAIADIKICPNGSAGSDGKGFSVTDFQLLDSEDRSYTFWNVQTGAREPRLTDGVLEALSAGSCKRGWLTFQLPPRAKVETVAYAPFGGTPLSWRAG